MSVQTTYLEDLPKGLVGARVDQEAAIIASGNVEPAAGIAFGEATAFGANDYGIVKWDSTVVGQSFAGITVRTRSVDPENPNGYAQYDEAAIMKEGVIWVTAGATVAAGGTVHVLTTGGVNAFVDVGGSQFDRMEYVTSGDAGDLVAIRVLF